MPPLQGLPFGSTKMVKHRPTSRPLYSFPLSLECPSPRYPRDLLSHFVFAQKSLFFGEVSPTVYLRYPLVLLSPRATPLLNTFEPSPRLISCCGAQGCVEDNPPSTVSYAFYSRKRTSSDWELRPLRSLLPLLCPEVCTAPAGTQYTFVE